MEQILIYSLISAFILLLAAKLTRSRRKKLPPSPFGLPILGHLHLLKEPLHRTLFNLSQSHGPIFSLRVGSRFLVVVSSPSAVQECFTKNDIVLANRPRFLMGKYVGYNNTTLAFAPYELTFNIIMRMIAGKRYFGDDVSGNKEEGRRFRKIIMELFELAVSSYPGDFFPILQLFDYAGYIKRITSLGNESDEIMQGMIDEHRRNKSDLTIKNTMITHLLSLQESQPEYYTDEIIKGLMQVKINAGTDTTAITLEWAMSNLLNNPHVLEKARAEIDKQVGRERLVEEADLSKLPYLQNIISETLRLYPAAPLLVPHLASDNCSIGGYDIPKETVLMVNAWAIQRDPQVWDDPTSFKPERFESKEINDQTYKVMPFGLGRRACPGMGLAQHVLGLTLGSLIQCFEWKRVSEKKIDMTEGQGLSMPKVEPLEAMCKACPIANSVLNL
ncbi:hypothetical protein PTKIN_Ptkin07bG0267900 [Pterospermum kingtungense]